MFKKLGLLFGFILLTSLCFADPSNQINTPYSFSPGTTIQSAQVNSDFSTVQNSYNTHTHTDIAQLGTVTVGLWNASPIGTQFGGLGASNINVPQGSIFYFNGTGTVTTLPAGTAGDIFISQGAGANPKYLSVLPTSNGGTGQTAGTNAANGVVILDATANIPSTIKVQAQFGAWVDKSSNYGAQQAATDGFVVVYTGSDGLGITGYTDGNADPTTIRIVSTIATVTGSKSFTMPVRKNDYWKIVKDAGVTSISVFWIPLGA